MNKYDAFLIKYAEIGIKGKNRHVFEEALVRQIRIALRPCEGRFAVSRTYGRVFVEAHSDYDFDEVTEALSHVFGIWGICPVAVHDLMPLPDLCRTAAAFMQEEYPEGIHTFKVRTRRMNKEYPQDSLEVNAELGRAVLEACPGMSVDVHTPEIMLSVEIREKLYLYSHVIPGPGGMPVGTNGRAQLLLSGGIDSPVAAYELMKRGLRVEAVHFASPPYTSENAKQKVLDLAAMVSEYQGHLPVHLINFTDIQLAIYKTAGDPYAVTLMRRMMFRLAQAVAEKYGCLAIGTGESVGQVASQTLESIACINSVVTMPVLRPLICMDKLEIIDIAKQIGTYETSILPFEDCCTIFDPKNPVTKPTIKKSEFFEARFDWQPMLDKALEEMQTVITEYREEQEEFL